MDSLSDKKVSIVLPVYNGEKYFSASEEIKELLQIGVVLEYNGERWCDLHPLVKKWLKEHRKV